MIEDWIDTLVKVWEVSDGKKGKVQAYRLFERDEFPNDISLDHPVALTFWDDVEIDYSLGGPTVAIYNGMTYFHLTPDTNRRRLPYVLGFVGRIIEAAAAKMQLSGKVNYFIVTKLALAAMQYGNEAPHFGLEVTWTVKEEPTITVSQ